MVVRVAITRALGDNHQRVGVAITRELGWQSTELGWQSQES